MSKKKKTKKKKKVRKCIHIAFDDATIFKLKNLLNEKDVSMQLLFESFAEALVANIPEANSILHTIILKKMIDEQIIIKQTQNNKRPLLENLDEESLYKLINVDLV